MPEEYTEIAQRLTGIAGWICGAYRLDAYLAFVAVAQHVSTNLTKRVWNAVLRWCYYRPRLPRCPALLPPRWPRHPVQRRR